MNGSAISIHALLAESDGVINEKTLRNLTLFLSTLSLRRATPRCPAGGAAIEDFYPRSPCGERQIAGCAIFLRVAFLSTLSLRRATSPWPSTSHMLAISIHALLAESDHAAGDQHGGLCISIHALLAESDRNADCSCHNARPISIHALLAESDLFYAACPFLTFISIHALLAESDVNDAINGCNPELISIHALLAESDHAPSHSSYPHNNFYPRSPCGERRRALRQLQSALCHFYPRSPCGERPGSVKGISSRTAISIHALLAESDSRTKTIFAEVSNFYPRSPCGERQ